MHWSCLVCWAGLGLALLGLLGWAWLSWAWLGLAWLGLAWLGLAGLGLAGLGLLGFVPPCPDLRALTLDAILTLALCRWFQAGKHRFVFLQKDPLHFVMISTTGESNTHVRLVSLSLFASLLSHQSAKGPLVAQPPLPSLCSWPYSSPTSTTRSSLS